jgi:flagellar basal-body rod modification protein FlgD
MAITPIGINAQSTGKVTTEANGAMGKYDFLKLLIAQMRHQDPLNPTDNAQMVAQMAQFSSLEQMTNMSQSFTSIQSLSMLGRTVKATATDGSVISGKVASVHTNAADPILVLEDGSLVMMPDVLEVTN